MSEDAKGKEKGITIGECYGLNRAVFQLLSSVPTMKGKIVYALNKNEAKLEVLLKRADEDQKKVLRKYVKVDKDGNFKLTKLKPEEIEAGEQPQYIYKVESDRSKAEEEVTELIGAEANIELHKIWINDFDSLDIVPARNQNIGLIVKYLVSESRDMQLA
jgi:hypothetical protein